MKDLSMPPPAGELAISTGAAPTAPLANRTADEGPALWFHRLATHYVEAQALFHLNQVGVFSALASGHAYSASELAHKLDLVERVLATLLEYVLTIDELLVRDTDGRYALSPSGRAIIERFSSTGPESEKRINLFDVRVGGYGPVWANLEALLTGTGKYGDDFRRDGKYAETGVRKLSRHFWPVIDKLLRELPVEQALEIGLTTGIIERIGVEHPQLALFGLDKNPSAIASSAESACAQGVRRVTWLKADLFDLAAWQPAVPSGRPGIIYSLHFHEFLAEGPAKLIDWLRAVKAQLPGWYLVLLEQPLLGPLDRQRVSEVEWLYSQSNVLIHHLIGNGRILSHKEWSELGQEAGCVLQHDLPCGYLGYRAFVYKL